MTSQVVKKLKGKSNTSNKGALSKTDDHNNNIVLRNPSQTGMNNSFMNNLMMASTVTNMITRTVTTNEIPLSQPMATIVIHDDDDSSPDNNTIQISRSNSNNSYSFQTANHNNIRGSYSNNRTSNENTNNLTLQEYALDKSNLKSPTNDQNEYTPDDSLKKRSQSKISTTKISFDPGDESDSVESGNTSEYNFPRRKCKRKKKTSKHIQNQKRRQWRKVELSSARKAKQLWNASKAGRVELNTEQARDKGKIVMPSTTILPKSKINSTENQGNNHTHNTKFIEFEDLKPPNLNEKINFGERNIQKHSTKVANLACIVLTKIDDIIYHSSGLIDWERVNDLWELLMGIPQSILKKLKSNEDTKDNHHNTNDDISIESNPTNGKQDKQSSKIIQEQSLYNIEMKDSDIPGCTAVPSMSQLKTQNQVLKQGQNEGTMIDDPTASKDLYLDLPKDNVFVREFASYITESKINQKNIITEEENTIRINVGRLINIKSKEIEKADKKICKNNISSASNILLNAPTIIENNIVDTYDADEAYEKLLELHYYNEADTLQTLPENNNDSIEIVESVVDFKNLINSLNRRSAEDIYGWSAELLYRICKEKPIIITALMRTINAFMIYNIYPQSLFKCRMIAIPKRNKAGAYRPISIPGVFRKLISKVMMKFYSKDIKDSLAPHQLGVGTPFSSETIITTIQNTIDTCIIEKDNACIVQLDLSNAYNRVDRNKLLTLMVEKGYEVPVIQYVKSMFQQERLIFYKSNTPLQIENNRGVAQGEIMSPLLFSLYLSDAIKDTLRITNELIYMNNSSTSSSTLTANTIINNKVPHIMSYLDDIFIIAPNTNIASIMTANIVTKLSEKNMITNFDKCNTLIINNGIIQSDSNLNIPVDPENNMTITSNKTLKVLGTMISLNPINIDNYFIRKANDTLRILTRSVHLHKQTFLILVRMCISSRLIHLTKTMNISNKLITDFDQIVNQLICSNFCINRDNNLIPMINKPFSLGGISILSLGNSMMPLRASLINELNKINHIHNLNKIILNEDNRYIYHLCSIISNIDKLSHIIKKENIIYNNDIKINSHELWKKEAKQNIEEIIMEASMNKPGNATLLEGLAKDNNTSKWLQAIPYFPYQKIDNDTLNNSMQYRLGERDDTLEYIKQLPETTYSKPDDKDHCPLCGHPIDEYHFSCCQCTGPMRTSRHNIIKKLLSRLLNQNPNITIKIEEKIEDVKGYIPDITVTYLADSNKEFDIEKKYRIRRNTETPRLLRFGIDITISEIHARNNLQMTKKGLFANLGEGKKLKHYKLYNEMNEIKIIPFGMSSVGGLGQCATDILQFIQEANHSDSIREEINKFKECSSVLIESVRYNMKQLYIDTINDRLKRISKSKPTVGTQISDTLTIPINQSSKVIYQSNSSYWNRELETQRKLDILNSPVTLIHNNDKIQNETNLPWLNSDRRKELYNSDNRLKKMSIKEDTSESEAESKSESESNRSNNEKWNLIKRIDKRNRKHNKLHNKHIIDNDSDYKDIDSNTDDYVIIYHKDNNDITNNSKKTPDIKNIYIKDNNQKDTNQEIPDIENNIYNNDIYLKDEETQSHIDIYNDNNIDNNNNNADIKPPIDIHDVNIYNNDIDIAKDTDINDNNVYNNNRYIQSSIDMDNNISNNQTDNNNNTKDINIHNNNDNSNNSNNSNLYTYHNNNTDIIEHSNDPPHNSNNNNNNNNTNNNDNHNTTINNDDQKSSPLTVGYTINTTSTEQENTSDNADAKYKSKVRKFFIPRSYNLRSKIDIDWKPYNLRSRKK